MLRRRCAGCGEVGVDLCRRCRFALLASPPLITRSGIVAAMEFSGLGRELVVQLKYRNRRQLAAHLAEHLCRPLDPSSIDVVTWAPTGAARRRRRGYDQAELLARAIARRWRIPCRRMLFRSHGAAQTGRSRSDRLHGPGFTPRPSQRGRPPRVLVVDDVVTTGATLLAARAALLAAGAASVVMAAVAATPDRPHRISLADRRDVDHTRGAIVGAHLASGRTTGVSRAPPARSG